MNLEDKNEPTFTELMKRALIFPQVYKGTLVERVVGGYYCLNQFCKTQADIDAVIKKAHENIEQSIKQ